jgi:cell division protein FtsB
MKAKVVFNDVIPVKDFTAMTIWPYIFVRNKAAKRYNVVVNNHEHIHARQQLEMLIVGAVLAVIAFLAGFGLWSILPLPIFLWWYVFEWLFRLAQYRNKDKAYRNISFEREAYANQSDLAYLTNRKHFAWTKYLREY